MTGGAPPAADDDGLRARLDAVCAEGQAIFERFDRSVRERTFHPFVAADYEVVRRALFGLRASGTRASGAGGSKRRFLEWGSATGIITIMADLMGFDACGIEIDASLVETARAVAATHGSAARFVVGSFLPTGYVHRTPDGDARTGTLAEGPSGYLALGRPLEDFDIVFGYPWGGEEPVMHDVMRRYGSPKAILLLYDASGEIRAFRGGREPVALG